MRWASMKCSSRRNCNPSTTARRSSPRRLNEVQLPKELQRLNGQSARLVSAGLNEVQLPKELQRLGQMTKPEISDRLNEVQLPKELQRSA